MISSLQSGFIEPLSFMNARRALEENPNSSMAVRRIFEAYYSLTESGPYADTMGNPIEPGTFNLSFIPADTTLVWYTFSGDGSLIYGYSASNTMFAWNRSGKLVYSDSTFTGDIAYMTVSDDNSHLGVAYSKGKAIIHRIADGNRFSVDLDYRPHSPFGSLAFSPDSRSVAVSSPGNRITFHDLNGSKLYSLERHSGPVNAISFSPDSLFLASASDDSTLVIWRMDSTENRFRHFRTLDVQFESPVLSVDFATNSRYILTTCTDSVSEHTIQSCVIYNLNGKGYTWLWNWKDDDTTFRSNWWESTDPVYASRFTAGDAGFIYTAAKDSLDQDDTLQIRKSHVRFSYSQNSQIGRSKINKYIKKGEKSSYWEPHRKYRYAGVDMSTHGYVAIHKQGTATTELYHWDGVPLKRFPGTGPVFSPDGDYLLCSEEKFLCIYPAHQDEFIRILDSDDFLQKVDTSMTEWRSQLYRW
jgi:WD40 repeat protein